VSTIHAAKKKPTLSPPQSHHIDKRAPVILAASTADSDDELLTSRQLAQWLGVSQTWVEIGRVRGYGPPFERLGPHLIRYRRAKVKAWLDERSHRSTAEYAESA
jgi:predicted DNA-binding transcriptional regulator AlpA